MVEDLKKLGKLIKLERIKNDLSQENLAEKVGVSSRTISLIESGLQHPKFFLVVKIAQVLDFDINILI
ncbi:MAG: helix-turn-helix domain-containing protein [Candidatus Gastranaerophilales bacterium]|nr:helix-turn-helix domain-containing protein [Candidatus Gastranaerophilales bacterium]MCM1072906.1 helix-turn-helix domain-containing protein [Bacteroides sp.]